jgi:U3 small nucleolar RNA-associated protein 15
VAFLEGKRVLSASDDHTIKIWDLATEVALVDLQGHSDYVRTAILSPYNHNLVLSGSYDHSVKVWDITTQECTMSMDHGAPVEKVLFLKGGGLAVSCGSNKIKIWDILQGGKLIASLSPHQKTITTMVLDHEKAHLLTGSLDQQVKVIDLNSYKVVHTYKYPAAVLSLDISVCSSC